MPFGVSGGSFRYRIVHDFMADADKNRLALSVADRHCEFEEALTGNRRKYPTREFRLFAKAVRPIRREDTERPDDDTPQRCSERSRARRLSSGRTKAGAGRSSGRGRPTKMPPFRRIRSPL